MSLENKGIKASLSENAALLIAKDGFDPDFGARPLRRAIYDLIEDKLSDMILADELHENDSIIIDAKDDEIIIKKLNHFESRSFYFQNIISLSLNFIFAFGNGDLVV